MAGFARLTPVEGFFDSLKGDFTQKMKSPLNSIADLSRTKYTANQNNVQPFLQVLMAEETAASSRQSTGLLDYQYCGCLVDMSQKRLTVGREPNTRIPAKQCAVGFYLVFV